LLVGAAGIEGPKLPASADENRTTSRDDSGDNGAHRRSRAVDVASLATALAEAVLGGDIERAKTIARSMQERGVGEGARLKVKR
jgi:hypothetical protein